MTPIRKGTAKRLGLNRPQSTFAECIAAAERDFEAVVRMRFLLPPMILNQRCPTPQEARESRLRQLGYYG